MHQQFRIQLADVLSQASSLFSGHLLIDKLVLKVDAMTSAQLETMLVPGAIREVEHQLALLLSSVPMPKQGQTLHMNEDGSIALLNAGDSLRLNILGQQEGAEQLGPRKAPQRNDAMTLEEFLLTGCLSDPQRWLRAGGSDAWLMQLLVAPTSSLLAVVVQASLTERMLQRLTHSFHSSTLHRLNTTLGGIALQARLDTRLVSLSLTALEYCRRNPQIPLPAVDQAVVTMMAGSVTASHLEEWNALLPEDFAANSRLLEWVQALRNEVGIEGQRNLQVGQRLLAPTTLSPKFYASDASHDRALATDGFELQISNAGVVLLWPLLPRLFAECGWLLREDGIGQLSFADAAAQQAAVSLLDYLCWNEEPVEEWRCSLNKWLCGMPFGQVLERLAIAPESLLAVGRCLSSLLLQLPALRRCTEVDLRAMYLQRPGTLRKTEIGWKLQVESDPSDILLGEMPWPMDELALPWLETALPVRWLHN